MVLEVTPRVSERAAVASHAERRFRALVDLMRGKRRPLILLQHNPDPDALASGMGLKHILRRVLRQDPLVAFTGSVGRSENRAMLRYLKIQIVPAFKVNYGHHEAVLVVDTQPGLGTCRLPEGVTADVVVDHHSSPGRLEGVRLAIVDPEYGATSTIVGEMMLANGLAIPERVATALVYGIQTDTQDLARNVSPADERVFADLYPLADKRLLGRIQRARVPQWYFVSIERGLRHAQVHGNAVTTHLGDIEHPDLVAEMADLLFRLEGMTWSFVTGVHAHVLYGSLRAIESEGIDAGTVAREIASPRGSGGGHEAMAAVQIPIASADTGAAAHEEVVERFLTAAGVKRTLTRPLTVPPPVEGEA